MLIMSSVLTEMVTDKDFSLLKSSMAVFLCFMGRFILGPFSGSFLQDYGLWTGQVIACICFLVATIVFLAADVVSLAGFIVAMTLTGLGWHFGFAVGNLSLSQNQEQDTEEGLQTQAHHDFAVFFTSGLIVLSSNLANPSWHTVLSIATVITILLMITSAVSYYLGFTLTEAEIAKITRKAEARVWRQLVSRSLSVWSEHRVKAGMEGVQDIKNMLKSMMEQQEKLMAKVEGIQEKAGRTSWLLWWPRAADRMEQQQDRMEQQQSQQMTQD